MNDIYSPAQDKPTPCHDRPPLYRWALWLGFAALAAWLYLRNDEHLVRWLPILLVLACPLMHVLGHRGHGHGGRRESPPATRGDDDAPAR